MFCRACRDPNRGAPPPPPPPPPPEPPIPTVEEPEEMSVRETPTATVVEAPQVAVAAPAPDWWTLSTVFLAVATAMVAAATRSSTSDKGWAVALREAVLFLAGWLWGAYSLFTRSTGTTPGSSSSSSSSSEAKTKVEEPKVSSLHGTRDARLAARLAKAIDFLETSAQDPESVNWARWGEKRGVDVWLQTTNGIKHSRGVAVIHAPPDVVIAALEDETTKDIYDKQWRKTTLVKDLDPRILTAALQKKEAETFIVRRDEYKPVFPSTARDAVVAYCRVSSVGGGSKSRLLCLASVQPDDDGVSFNYALDDSNYVRMDISCGGYLVEPHDEGSKVTAVVMLDPKGMIPKSVVNFVAFDRPMGLARLQEVPLISDVTRWALYKKDRRNDDDEEKVDDELQIRAHAERCLVALLAIDADPTTMGFTKDAMSTERRSVYFASSFTVDGTPSKPETRPVKRYAVCQGPVKHPPEAIHGALDANVAKIDKNRESLSVATSSLLSFVGRHFLFSVLVCVVVFSKL